MTKLEAWQEFGRSVGLIEEVLTPNGDGGISISVGEWRDAFYAGWDARGLEMKSDSIIEVKD